MKEPTTLAIHTGDNPRSARAIAGRLGIEQVMAELLPEEFAECKRKVEFLSYSIDNMRIL